MTEPQEAGAEQQAAGQASRMRIRLSTTGYLILALVAVQLVLTLLAILLPWGHNAFGRDIRLGLEGLLPWFLLVPAFAQVGFLMVDSGMLQAFYLVLDFLVALLVIGIQWLTYLKYSSFQPGFYMVFIAGGLAVLGGFLCMLERRLFPERLSVGKAKVMARQAPAAGE